MANVAYYGLTIGLGEWCLEYESQRSQRNLQAHKASERSTRIYGCTPPVHTDGQTLDYGPL